MKPIKARSSFTRSSLGREAREDFFYLQDSKCLKSKKARIIKAARGFNFHYSVAFTSKT